MFMLNPVVAILHNEELNRWHPIVFCEAPFPGVQAPGAPTRLRSKGHHTDGFADRCEAVTAANGYAEKIIGAKLDIDEDIPWDGKGIPAMNLLCHSEADGSVRLSM